METIIEQNTQIFISKDLSVEALIFFLKEKSYSTFVLISDKQVFSLHGTNLVEVLQALQTPLLSIEIEAGEESKNWETAGICLQKMHTAGVDKNSLVISFGGGVVSDFAGFVASCYMRGIDVIHAPTTLMGMVDASIGGKTALNLISGKNIAGSFHQPQAVFMFLPYLNSLPQNEYLSGVAEIVKYAIINGEDLFEYIENQSFNILNRDLETLYYLVKKCSELKSTIVMADEKEKLNLRVLLNLGHTFAHALETMTYYRQFRHGEAVSIGLSCAFYISYLLNKIPYNSIKRLHILLKQLSLPIDVPNNIDYKLLIEVMRKDKKAINQQLNLVLLKKIGEVEVVKDVKSSLVLEALHQKEAEKSKF